mmetsp:Transcript_56108/g.88958  ORF Transcript_56108/g.88958 Transcript_56108/m.88958 type:complete len:136 (-) Transcript_56108:462-869(-)|eukprot:CAMPEP_0169105164 /NCGR_PEP_ID=MMETSP1015-20121227/23643_1 /TAXON_ID=342587 /ORGANISM="Karlodinium micrum, Strain CCMP2283" /LENGTH=135 /DNA_ID=CAMNT_0009166491 /DNA_START=69 /DNA_END=476 /DNA_ORIENTATION=-
MGCSSSSSKAAAAPKANSKEENTLAFGGASAADAKKLSDYAKLLVSSDPDDVKAALQGLSDESRRMLEAIVNPVAEANEGKAASDEIVQSQKKDDQGDADADQKNGAVEENAVAALTEETDNKVANKSGGWLCCA